jgi:excinuclease ABC subunit C
MRRYPWQPATSDIPQQPGVYRFLGTEGRVIYVGKAKNLRSRLTSYFQAPDKLLERTRRMVANATTVDWTVVPTERQALQLEYLWIKEFSPEFNIRFRDDKSYPYLALTLADDIPRVFLARRKGIKGARYFGPFPTAGALRDTLQTVLKAFPVRSCTQGTYQRAERNKRPCLLGDIGKCAAPCVGRISAADHKALALSLSGFMEGFDESVVQELRSMMTSAAENLDFERAARYRDRLEAVNTILMKNTMVLDDSVEADVFGLARDALVAAAHVFRVRGGRIRSARGFIVDIPDNLSDAELVDMMLRDGFEDQPPPRVVVVPHLPSSSEAWEEELTQRRLQGGLKGKVSLKAAKRGELATLGATVRLNAEQTLSGYLSSRTSDPQARSRALAELQDALDLQEAPLRIECFDVSHLGGDNPVASMVVFEDGVPHREHYRKFALNEPRDDTEAIAEVITRRTLRLVNGEADVSKGFSYPPGLIVVDGGLPQVNAASRAMAAVGIHIPVCGLAKKMEEVWTPNASYPIILARGSDALFLLQRVRDEAHRVAIRYQRQTRKRTLQTDLSQVPGVGAAKAREVLRHFGSLARVKNASLAELSEVAGIGPQLAQKIEAFFRSPSG